MPRALHTRRHTAAAAAPVAAVMKWTIFERSHTRLVGPSHSPPHPPTLSAVCRWHTSTAADQPTHFILLMVYSNVTSVAANLFSTSHKCEYLFHTGTIIGCLLGLPIAWRHRMDGSWDKEPRGRQEGKRPPSITIQEKDTRTWEHLFCLF